MSAGAVMRWLQVVTSPVHQNVASELYCSYRGQMVPMTPVVLDRSPWLVSRWEIDPYYRDIADGIADSAGLPKQGKDEMWDEGSTPNMLVRWWQRIRSRVHQNPDDYILGDYEGHTIRMVPVMCSNRPWLVERWIGDPESVLEIKNGTRADDCYKQDTSEAAPQEGCKDPPELPPEDDSQPKEAFNAAAAGM